MRTTALGEASPLLFIKQPSKPSFRCCLLYTSDAADEEDSVDLGGRRSNKKKKKLKKYSMMKPQ